MTDDALDLWVPMTCDLCDREAKVYATEIRGGTVVERRLCAEHGAEGDAEIVAAVVAGGLVRARSVGYVTCEHCSARAVQHLTETRGGQVIRRHLCDEHATQRTGCAGKLIEQVLVNGVVCSPLAAAVRDAVLADLRARVNFIRRHGRLPTSQEELLEAMAAPGEPAAAGGPAAAAEIEIRDAAVRASLLSLERSIDLCERHGVVPLDQLYRDPDCALP